jgi:hypothetical protein
MKKPPDKPDVASIFGADEAPKKPSIFSDDEKPAAPKIFSDDDKPAAPKVFSEDEKAVAPKVFKEGEKGRFCRYCRHYVVNPFTQRCALHRRAVEATDTCPQFDPAPPPEEDAP